ncbi:MAG: site-2 protease family protein [Candidatus Obscuribacterales bacterium]|nr:site-2 protease family protein [Candidatus Obscuribacterales bacterium]
MTYKAQKDAAGSSQSSAVPAVARFPQKPALLSASLAGLSVFFLSLALSLLLDQPLLGKGWITWLGLGATLLTMLTIVLTSIDRNRQISDIRMLLPAEQVSAVKEIMNVRVASVEDGIHSYRGYLTTDSDLVYEHLHRSRELDGIMILLSPDDKLDAQISLIPRYKQPPKPSTKIHWSLHIVLFLITATTATFAGAIHQGINPLSNGVENWKVGLPYALSLLTILGLHETGHYAIGRFYKMNVTPPFFIPAPLPLGTFGAVISMRSPSRTRKAMFDTATAGPLIGLVAAVIFLFIGLPMSSEGVSVFESDLLAPKSGSSALFTVIAALANPDLKYGATLDLHPCAFAGWLGLLITAINLIPVGQLDGGRMAAAMFGPKAGDILSTLALATLMGLAIFVWPNLLIFTVLIFFLAGRSDRALDSVTPLGPLRTTIGLFAFICLVAILVPLPEEVVRWLVK